MKFNRIIGRITRSVIAGALALTVFLTSSMSTQAAVLGIDVSKFQGGINWGAVPSSGVSYVFIKAGSVKSGVDPCFAANLAGAQAAGLRTGAYIYSYATSVQGAVNEANLMLQWIAPYTITFPVVYDIEDKLQKNIDANTITAMCNAFCDVMYGAGYYPMIYTGKYFFQKHMTADLRYDYWIAQYASQCDIPGAAIWQASCTGSVAGISGAVDIDWMNKDYFNIIIPEGFTSRGGFTYFYRNYRTQMGWVEYNGARYHMDTAFHMNTGWFEDESGTYYLAEDGHALVGKNQVGDGIYYFVEDGRITGGWVTIGEQVFYFDPANGNRMLTGWMDDAAGRHYLTLEDGHMATGTLNIENKNYLFSPEGVMLTGWQKLGENMYYFAPGEGARQFGWLGDIENRYYLATDDGRMLTGWQVIEDKHYFFNEKGVMQRGMITVGEGTYYFDPATGAMVTGFVGDVENRYYFSPADGHMLTGWQIIDGKHYYFNEKGVMQRGMIQLGEDHFYFDPATGAMMTGFVGDIENRYYFAPDGGRMITGQQVIDGYNYYFGEDGKMLRGWQSIGDVTWYYNPADGKMVRGWIRGTEATYYTSLEDGHMVRQAAVTIEDKLYVFNTEGVLVAGGNYTIGEAIYSCDEKGIATRLNPEPAPAAAEGTNP